MKYAIIAAGEGTRLAEEGVCEPKPLVRINGECLIDRLIRIFMSLNAEEIVVVCNNLTPHVQEHLEQISKHGLKGMSVPLRYVVRTTPSSMHSFFELSKLLKGSSFLLTTVDTIFLESEFADFMRAFQQFSAEGWNGVMGVTDYIDDEKPLYVATNEKMNITGFYDDNQQNCKYISAGIYGLDHTALVTLENCVKRGESRMRNFQRALVSDGRSLKAYAFSKVLDIDHVTDIKKAESFLNE